MAAVRRFPNLPDVHCSGEALGSPVYWLGLQWAVTADGVERRDGGYVVNRDRIHEADNGYTWEDHIAAKGWADMQDFRAAMDFARKRWPKRVGRPVRGPAWAGETLDPLRPGRLITSSDTLADANRAMLAQTRLTKAGDGFVELHRSGSKGLKHLPPNQSFAVDVREVRGLIRILRQAEASAVRHGLLDEAAEAS